MGNANQTDQIRPSEEMRCHRRLSLLPSQNETSLIAQLTGLGWLFQKKPLLLVVGIILDIIHGQPTGNCTCRKIAGKNTSSVASSTAPPHLTYYHSITRAPAGLIHLPTHPFSKHFKRASVRRLTNVTTAPGRVHTGCVIRCARVQVTGRSHVVHLDATSDAPSVNLLREIAALMKERACGCAEPGAAAFDGTTWVSTLTEGWGRQGPASLNSPRKANILMPGFGVFRCICVCVCVGGELRPCVGFRSTPFTPIWIPRNVSVFYGPPLTRPVNRLLSASAAISLCFG